MTVPLRVRFAVGQVDFHGTARTGSSTPGDFDLAHAFDEGAFPCRLVADHADLGESDLAVFDSQVTQILDSFHQKLHIFRYDVDGILGGGGWEAWAGVILHGGFIVLVDCQGDGKTRAHSLVRDRFLGWMALLQGPGSTSYWWEAESEGG